MEILQAAVTGLITGAFSAGSIWGVLRTSIKYLQRDVDSAHHRIDRHEEIYHGPERRQK